MSQNAIDELSEEIHKDGQETVSELEALHGELKELIVETLALEDIDASEIETDGRLFVEGLGLDSIDSLELAMMLEERFGVVLDDDPEANQAIFQSVRSLASFVSENRSV
jgi:acyl carrier protein